MEKQGKRELSGEQEEQDFLDNFKRNSGSSIKTLLGLSKGHYASLFFSVLFFFIKHSPVWILPIVTSNIINIATNPDENVVRDIALNVAFMCVMIIQNVFFQLCACLSIFQDNPQHGMQSERFTGAQAPAVVHILS